MTEICTKEQFLENIKEHEMTIIRDDGLYRHVRFSKPESTVYRFDLITWPGHVCYTGDMGTFVFSRITDMFDFFGHNLDDKYPINPHYWGEKVLSESRFGGYKEYDQEDFEIHVKTEFEEGHTDDIKYFPFPFSYLVCAYPVDLWHEVERDVLHYACDGQDRAMWSAHDFRGSDGFTFEVYEWDVTRPTYHYIWCCYALVWGIGLYKKEKGEKK